MQHRVVGWGIAAIVGMFVIPSIFGIIFSRGGAYDDLRGSVEGECRYSSAGVYTINATVNAAYEGTQTADGDAIVRFADPERYDFTLPAGSTSVEITGDTLTAVGVQFPGVNAQNTPVSGAPNSNHDAYAYVLNGVVHPVAFNSAGSVAFTNPTNATRYATYNPYLECQPAVSGTPRPDVAQPANIATVVGNGNGYVNVDYRHPAVADNTFQPIVVVMISFIPLLLIVAGILYLWSNRRASGARR